MNKFLLLIIFLSFYSYTIRAQSPQSLATKDSLGHVKYSIDSNIVTKDYSIFCDSSLCDSTKKPRIPPQNDIKYSFLSYQYWVNKLFHAKIDDSYFVVYSGLNGSPKPGISLIDSIRNPLKIHQATIVVQKKVPFSIFQFKARKYAPLMTKNYKPFSLYDLTRPLFETNKAYFIDTTGNVYNNLDIKDSIMHDPFFLKHFWVKDTVRRPTLIARPYFENGMYFFKNDSLKSRYKTNSIFYIGFGVNVGHIETHRIIPFFQISLAKYKINKAPTLPSHPDSTISIKQFIIGTILPIYSTKDLYFRLKLGYNLTIIRESFFGINDIPFGLQLGIGIERRFIRNTRVYFDFSYLYQKSTDPTFKDFDMTRLCFGIVL